ncbi:tumor necrosis factor receptor superfamily member 14-like isoform X4 [Hemibagrus wyckioides]|nr:tumor necrosis factor receptor superfamily member 14-like isoform X4 [Hemibagrus wyckioides]XP_058245644.1 tumor necrosis factor receptor superfamily member 14-like isoform X4 [Hemibagrus wyckioides]XP_058245645.1 tumor necrosis factor receptor superfamily member 14-like isoform X4 [Hemibagrus wyckioides]
MLWFDKIMKSAFLTRLHILGICAALTFGSKCGQSEYLSAAEECCPMCAIGSVVLKDCHGDYSTTCKPCSKGTFMNEPNGLHACFQCKICENGLYISQNCTTIKDTVCGVLDGYYCMHYSDERRDCSLAIKHSKCKPGEQIKTPGTKSSDTVCEPCLSGFYSPEGVNCSKWTDCSVKNEIEDQEGTSIKDVQCKPGRNRYGLIAAFLIDAVLLLSLIVLYFSHRLGIRCELCWGFFSISNNTSIQYVKWKSWYLLKYLTYHYTTIFITIVSVCFTLILCTNTLFIFAGCRTLKSPVAETNPHTSQCVPSTSQPSEIQKTDSPALHPDCNKEHKIYKNT